MRPSARALQSFAAAISAPALLLLACASAPPPAAPARVVAPPPATELVLPPPAQVTICQRDAKPTAGADPVTVASFEKFSQDWIGKMKTIAAARFATDRKRLRETYEMELRPTGSSQAPYVGVLSYCEVTLECAGAAVESCKPSRSTVVKEMFRFQAGKWVY
jgi:hypothetical protein